MQKSKISFGFVLSRKNFIRVISNLIDYVHDKEHEVIILYKSNEPHIHRIDMSLLKKLFENKYKYVPFNTENFQKVVLGCSIDILVFLEGPRFLLNEKILHIADSFRQKGIRLISISFYYDTALTPYNALEKFDLICLFNEYHKYVLKRILLFQKRHENLHYIENDVESLILKKTVVTGMPLYENMEKTNKETLRKKYNIPDGKKVVLIMLPYFDLNLIWIQQVWKPRNFIYRFLRAIRYRYLMTKYIPDMIFGMSFRQFVKLVKDFCTKNNAILISKKRVKNYGSEIDIVEQICDLNFSDDEFYPIDTTSQLILLADLVITIRSNAIPDIVYANVPLIHLLIPFIKYNESRIDVYNSQMSKFVKTTDRDYSLFRFDRCFPTIEYKKFKQYLESKNIDDIVIDQNARTEYLDKFGMMEDLCASKEIYKAIQKAF